MKKINVYSICFVALAAVLNIVGGNIALLLRLPIYLDSLGTMLTAALMGPLYGMIPGILSGVLSGCINDPYAFYYIPVQMIIGLITGGLVWRFSPEKKRSRWFLFLFSAVISIPGTAVSSAITAFLFGGITSSGSTLLVQLLHGSGLNLTASVFLVQAATDYIDRTVVLFAAILLYRAVPAAFRARLCRNQAEIRSRRGPGPTL
ncbi:MAG: ECF transporter S component [Lachnospiraceae bacterium]